MTREEWANYEKIARLPDVRTAMRARCEEQGHEFEFCFSALWDRFDQCKWCGDRKNIKAGLR